MLISISVAMAKNRVIGKNGQLPWSLPSDLQRFKRLTMGQTLIMGRRTFESIGKPLPGRRTIILSRNADYPSDCPVATSLSEALTLAEPAAEVFICGGENVYRQALPVTDRIYLTQLNCEISGDTFFPEFSRTEFVEIYTKDYRDTINYRFFVLQRHHCDAPWNFDVIEGK